MMQLASLKEGWRNKLTSCNPKCMYVSPPGFSMRSSSMPLSICCLRNNKKQKQKVTGNKGKQQYFSPSLGLSPMLDQFHWVQSRICWIHLILE